MVREDGHGDLATGLCHAVADKELAAQRSDDGAHLTGKESTVQVLACKFMLVDACSCEASP